MKAFQPEPLRAENRNAGGAKETVVAIGDTALASTDQKRGNLLKPDRTCWIISRAAAGQRTPGSDRDIQLLNSRFVHQVNGSVDQHGKTP